MSESRREPFSEAPAIGADGGVQGLAFGVRVIPFGSRLYFGQTLTFA